MRISILIIIISTCLSTLAYSQQSSSQILATVGDHNITLSEFDERYTNYLLSTGVKDNLFVREAILENLINEILLYYYDSNENILNDSKYLKELEKTRIRTILAYLKDQEVYAKITVSEQEVREAFSRVNEEIAARHLFAKTEEEANNLYELVKIGVDFDLLAKQVFTDSVLKNNGGYLGYFTWGDMDPSFEDAAYSLKIGEISAPVKTEYGYSIIKLEDRITNPLLTESEFQRKKSHLENVVKMRKKEPSEINYINNIFDKSKLTFKNENLEKILVKLYSKENIESGNYNSLSEECARYGDKMYSRAAIEQMISDLPSYYSNRINSIESLQAAIEGILLKDTLYDIAISKGYDTTKVVLDRIEKYKMSTFLKFKKDEIISKAQLPDSVIFKYYKDNISSFSTEPELNLQEILVENEELANSIIKLLNEGSDFGELAKKYSLRKWSADNDGIMGYAPVSKFGNYKKLFWDSQVGEIIGPVKIEDIYGIFRILGKEESNPLDFGTIKGEVIKASQFENQTEILQDYLEKIRRKVNIGINEDMLSSDKIVE
ncbi:MAG: peptidylprolyl isomerase [Ignavibacteriaceae bacterium]|nr:peptidylprolyl isomerase [Ignavibacteriaceae bacterium]